MLLILLSLINFVNFKFVFPRSFTKTTLWFYLAILSNKGSILHFASLSYFVILLYFGINNFLFSLWSKLRYFDFSFGSFLYHISTLFFVAFKRYSILSLAVGSVVFQFLSIVFDINWLSFSGPLRRSFVFFHCFYSYFLSTSVLQTPMVKHVPRHGIFMRIGTSIQYGHFCPWDRMGHGSDK